jgi:hypothetical protein
MYEPHDAEIERAAAQRIDLPANCHGGDLIGEFRKAACPEIEQERLVTE